MEAGTAVAKEAAKRGATVGAKGISTRVSLAARVEPRELRVAAEVAVEDAVAMVADGGA